jgi:tetratricopeptide (TPR) repeat protein
LVVLAVAVALCGTPTGAATKFPSPRQKWIRAETAHFTLLSNASKRRTSEIAENLERYRAILAHFLNKGVELSSPSPTLVYIFKHENSFKPYMPLYKGKTERHAGWFAGYPTANFMAMNGSAGDDHLDVFFHEYIHFVFNNNIPNVPLWFEEGLAECFSTFRTDGAKAMIGEPIPRHLKRLRGRSLMELEEFLRLTHHSESFHVEDNVGPIYAQSWALVHYLLWAKPNGNADVHAFLGRLRSGEDIDTAFETSFDKSYDELLYALRGYVDQRRFQYSVVEFGALDIDTKVELTPMSRAEVLYRLGDLLARQGAERYENAEAHLQEALKSDPSIARAHAAIGWIRERQDRLDDAIAGYEKAFALDADDYLINYLLGDALVDRAETVLSTRSTESHDQAEAALADVERAQELFRRSILGRPGFAVAYLGYSRAIVYGGDGLDGAISVMHAAQTLLPARSDIVMNLAILYAYNEDTEEAHRIIDKYLSHMGNPEALKTARRVVAETEARLSQRQAWEESDRRSD